MIEVSNVQFKAVPFEKGLVGFASCLIDDCFYLGNIAVFMRLDKKGYRLVFPVRRSVKGMKFKICFPITNEAYQTILRVITEKIVNLTDNFEL